MSADCFRKMRLLFIALIALITVSASVMAQNPATAASLSARLEPAQVKPGQKARLLITLKLEGDWHVYSLSQSPPPRSTRIALDESGVFKADGPAQQPKPKVAFDKNFEIDTETFADSVTFTLPVKVADDAAPGAQKVIAKVTYQVCDDHQCLPPRTRPVEAEATIMAASTAAIPPTPALDAKAAPTVSPSVAPSVKPSPSPSTSPSPSPGASPLSSPSVSPSISPAPTEAVIPPPVNNANGNSGGTGEKAVAVPSRDFRKNGLASYLWLALTAGLLSLLTPCVFPMIPITVSFFTKKAEQSKGKTLAQVITYCLGIILTFTGLGIGMTAIAGPTGISRLATNPWMNLFLMALFVVFALNLFGLFEIRIPSSILSKLDRSSQGSGFGSTLLMGLTFALTSFTCTAAFVGTVLVAATQGEWLWATLGMLTFATAFAFPFFLLALFPTWLKSLPKSGGWMNSVKVVMGFLELAAAFKFLSNVDLVWGWETISRSLVLSAWIAIAIITAVYLLGKFQLPYDSPLKNLGVIRMLASVLFVGIAFYLLTGLFGARLGELDSFLPPIRQGEIGYNNFSGGGNTATAQARWIESYEEAVNAARAQNKPLFVNFTGVTCTNCRWMETNMFTQPEVKRELEKFVLAELYTDRETPQHAEGDRQHQELQEKKFGTVALPLYAIISPDGQVVDKFEGLTRDKHEFVKFLQARPGINQVAQSK